MSHDLVNELEQARAASRAFLGDRDLTTIASAAGTRRVQDILAHIAAWEREVAASIRASRAGETHTLPLPLDLDAQNEVCHEAAVGLPADDARAAWEDARRELVDAVGGGKATDEVTCPWGKVETVRHIVTDMIAHEQDHVDKLAAFFG